MADQLTETSARRITIDSSTGPLAALAGFPIDGSATTILLLVPGYTGSKEDFAPILDPLADLGFAAIAIDQPGQFESPGPADEAEYAPRALGAVLASVVKRLTAEHPGHPIVLLGHSFGGLVSREAVLAGADVRGLVLLCSGPAAFVNGNRFDALTSGEPVLRRYGAQVLYDRGQAAAGLDPHDPHPLQQFLRRRFLASDPNALLGMGGALLTEPDRTAELADVLARRRIPVAVIAGEADDAWPLDTQRVMAATLETELVLVPGGAHSPAVEAPENLVALLAPLLRRWVPAG